MIEELNRTFKLHNVRAHVERFLSMCKHVKASMGINLANTRHRTYSRLYPNNTVEVEAMLAWHSRYGLPRIWISNEGSHFRNEVMHELCRRLKARHDSTVTYSPWINGSVEHLHALYLEYKVNTHDWTFFVPILQASLNHTIVPSLGRCAPVKLFCGLPVPPPLKLCLDAKQRQLLEIPQHLNDIKRWFEQQRSSNHQLHKTMMAERAKQTKCNQKIQKAARRPNLDMGDFVLRSRFDQKHTNKLLVTWVGPY
ncbi:hypothetical protein PHMEG_00021164 [Phytophthora megakarya]|uniref:Integrase catalytic domain-containing protein n=1 Tax=Phytophthora megakarya TaxID=4795 RepID=A0A225VMB3_9STRA|nr:hypothetical protein PHMEG_00021164 [Phytophthora megakarya]